MAVGEWWVSKQYMADSGPNGGGAANPGDVHIPVGKWSPGTGLGWVTRAVLYAPINFSGMTSINSAYLVLCAHTDSGWHAKGSGTQGIRTRMKTADWGENWGGTATSIDEVWGGDGRSVVVDYTTPNGGTDQYFDTNTANGGEVWIDISAIVSSWRAGTPNYGVKIEAVDEGSSNGAFEFYSRHASGLQPKIYVDYNTNSAPNAPNVMSPTANTTLHTGTNVTVSGNYSDPQGDTMTGAHVQIWYDDLTALYVDYLWNPGGGSTFQGTFGVPYGNRFYQWRARVADSTLWSGWSGWHRFKVNTPPTPPSGSIAQTPANAIKTLTPTFTMSRNDADSAYGDYMSAYEIHLYQGPNTLGNMKWSSGIISVPAGTVTATKSYTGPALSWGTTYHWYPRAADSNSAWSNWNFSLPSFTTYKAHTPINPDPSASEIVGNLTPTFTGARGSTDYTITQYQIQVFESNGTTLKWDPGFSAGGIVNGATFSRAYAGSALSYNTQYKWRVRVTGNIGGTSDYTALQTFTTPSSTAATQTAPVGAPITTLTPTFTGTWNENLNGIQIIVYESNGTTVKWDTGTVAKTSATSYSHVYAGPALSWNTTYKWKVRVRRTADNLFQPYTGLATFTTDSAGQPTLTAPIDNSWQTTSTPTFTGTTFNAEVITTYRILLYEADGVTLTWDSGDLAGSGTSFSKVYNGANALVPGRTYKWKARYIKSTGPTGNYSALEDFHINAAPQSPTNTSPGSGGIVVGTLLPIFTADFEDVDEPLWADYPVQMEVEVRNNATDALIATQTQTTNLTAGTNNMTWDGTPALAYETEYKWRVRFRDSKNADGAWSAYSVFKPSEPSQVTLTSPVGTIVSPQVPVSWNFTSPGGKAQAMYRIRVVRNSDEIEVYDSGEVLSSSTSHIIPAGHLVNNTEYTFEVTVVDTDGI